MKSQKHKNKTLDKLILLSPQSWKRDRLIAGGLSGACFFAVIQLSTVTSLNLTPELTVAIYCFAVALPIFMAYILMAERALDFERISIRLHLARMVIMDVAGIIAFVGLTAIFLHFSFILGLIFIVFSIVGMGILVWFQDGLRDCARRVEREKGSGLHS